MSDIFSRPGISRPNGAMPNVLWKSKLEEIEGTFCLSTVVKHDLMDLFKPKNNAILFKFSIAEGAVLLHPVSN